MSTTLTTLFQGVLPTSSDWVTSPMPSGDNWQALAYGNNTLVAVTLSTPAASSTNFGTTWTARTLPSAFWSAVTYGPDAGVFAAVSGGSYNMSTVAASSPDGITWTQRTIPSGAWSSVAYGNGTFAAVSGAGYSASNTAATSPDGLTWTYRTVPSSQLWTGITYGRGQFFALARNTANCATSPDGINWTLRTAAMPSAQNWISVAYGERFNEYNAGTFAAIANNGAFAASSPDGITWTARTLPNTSQWSSVCAVEGGGFMAVSATTATGAYSPDGATWYLNTQLPPSAWNAVTSAWGGLYAVGNQILGARTGPAYLNNSLFLHHGGCVITNMTFTAPVATTATITIGKTPILSGSAVGPYTSMDMFQPVPAGLTVNGWSPGGVSVQITGYRT